MEVIRGILGKFAGDPNITNFKAIWVFRSSSLN